jgi:hypothetical protein
MARNEKKKEEEEFIHTFKTRCNTIPLIFYFLHLKIHSSLRVSSVLLTYLFIKNSVVMNLSRKIIFYNKY